MVRSGDPVTETMGAGATGTDSPPDGARSSRRERLTALLLYVVMGVVLLHGTWADFGNLGGKDWSRFLGQAQAELSSLRDHGEFPAWNPWRAGGQVSFAQPQSMFLSPVTPVALVTGANAAFKLWILPLFVIGAMGMYTLAGRLGLCGVAQLVPGAVFFGSSVFPLYVTGGLPNWLFGMALLPWLFVAHRRSLEDRRYVVAAAAAYAGLLWCGSIHHFLYFPLLFGLDAALLSLQRRGLRPLVVTACWGLAGAALAAVRLVPIVELFREYPRVLSGHGSFVPPALLPRLLFGAELPDLRGGAGGLLLSGGSAVYWINCGAFVGWAAGLLALLAVLRSPRRAAGPLLVVVVFAWLAMGSGIRPSLWDGLHRLPVFSSMHGPERFMLLVAFALALLAGLGFGVVEQALRRWSASRASPRRDAPAGAALGALLAAVVLPLLV
ncbi:MAG TPA: hypothetical protein VFD43_02230, partial [Planctomycetota bacterium]|nr:hypothetical protein [Planctomycetota bacterium]